MTMASAVAELTKSLFINFSSYFVANRIKHSLNGARPSIDGLKIQYGLKHSRLVVSWHVYYDVVESNLGPLGEKQESNPLETKTLITVFLSFKKLLAFVICQSLIVFLSLCNQSARHRVLPTSKKLNKCYDTSNSPIKSLRPCHFGYNGSNLNTEVKQPWAWRTFACETVWEFLI